MSQGEKCYKDNKAGKGDKECAQKRVLDLGRVVGKGLTEKMAFEQRLAEAIQIYKLID